VHRLEQAAQSVAGGFHDDKTARGASAVAAGTSIVGDSCKSAICYRPRVLDSLFLAPAVSAIGEALGSAHADGGAIGVVGHAGLVRALKASREVVAIDLSARAANKLGSKAIADVAPASLAAVIAVDVSKRGGWTELLAAWTAVVRDGGAVVLLDRGRAAEAARRALCAGLTELEQRHAGRAVVTSGLVTHLL
jgi:hypothetical protein